ncbi:HAMP domain-containing sensor histidine kinase [Clostridium sp. CF012]|uniref:sensor histidine kinase n=1 Tax=Clostridium sp. CF012 TaxID=2843319 RepID=UPI001C0CB0A0|nr:HAMP domain-containing sensor histidine kinase [Clostridium sp. CF012]MBU3143587.1 HAMP domain-containing histidine kinase [Clostridium sp. CF012]
MSKIKNIRTSIKARLLFSYITMLIVPIILTVMVALAAGLYYFSDAQTAYDVKSKIYPFGEIVEERDKIFATIKLTSLESPESFQDEIYLKNLEDNLLAINSGIIVRKNNQIVYSSSTVSDFNTDKYLPKFGEYVKNIPVPYRNIKVGLILSQQDFHFSDKAKGSVFLVTNVEPLKKAFTKFHITVSIFIILILIATNGTLTFIVARSIIKPLYKLKSAANKIKEGNLDFEITTDSKDEIGDVCTAFEEMRARLKKSIKVQLQYEENRKELITNISHDLKTPITAIKGYIEGIRDGVADTPEKTSKYINTIYTKASDVDKLIDELFLYSKLDLNKFAFNFTKVNVYQYIEDCIEELYFHLQKKNITINHHPISVEPIYVIADVQQLKRVFINVIENAVKYMDKAIGEINIMIEQDESSVIIEIKDNGQGIPKDALPYIFDRFYRADPARNISTGGSGLGLSIAKKIIEQHGGYIRAHSVEGEGTSMVFTLKKYRSGDIL